MLPKAFFEKMEFFQKLEKRFEGKDLDYVMWTLKEEPVKDEQEREWLEECTWGRPFNVQLFRAQTTDVPVCILSCVDFIDVFNHHIYTFTSHLF